MTARILIVAGSDSGGGAGIQADIKTATMLGAHAMTAVTAITAQNTLGVHAVHPIPAAMVLAQLSACLDDIGADAVKIGMVGAPETVHALADALAPLAGQGGIPIVFDPVMVATSGSVLADAATVAAFGRLVRLATLVTPNLPELAALGGLSSLLEAGATVLVKGGHAAGDTVTDRLVAPAGELARWSAPRIATPHTHGTGCTLATALATGLAQGMDLPAAAARARAFVRASLQAAPGLGQGHGPMGQQCVTDLRCPA